MSLMGLKCNRMRPKERRLTRDFFYNSGKKQHFGSSMEHGEKATKSSNIHQYFLGVGMGGKEAKRSTSVCISYLSSWG